MFNSASLHQQLGATLAQRQAELRTLLAAASPGDNTPEVQDFKDVAAEESRAVVDEVTHAHARQELVQVAAALRRIAEGNYGLCQDCGENIDARRLCALPATPYCTACQSIHERPRARR
jgi:DnaK suppressor protein